MLLFNHIQIYFSFIAGPSHGKVIEIPEFSLPDVALSSNTDDRELHRSIFEIVKNMSKILTNVAKSVNLGTEGDFEFQYLSHMYLNSKLLKFLINNYFLVVPVCFYCFLVYPSFPSSVSYSFINNLKECYGKGFEYPDTKEGRKGHCNGFLGPMLECSCGSNSMQTFLLMFVSRHGLFIQKKSIFFLHIFIAIHISVFF